MPVATTYIKLILILGGVVFFLYDLSARLIIDRVVPCGVAVAVSVHIAAYWSARLRRWLPNPAMLWAVPLFALCLWGRLQLEKPVPAPPALWYSLSPESGAKQKPIYDRSLIAHGTVRRWTGPRVYLVDLRLVETQRKLRRSYAKRKRRGKSSRKYRKQRSSKQARQKQARQKQARQKQARQKQARQKQARPEQARPERPRKLKRRYERSAYYERESQRRRPQPQSKKKRDSRQRFQRSRDKTRQGDRRRYDKTRARSRAKRKNWKRPRRTRARWSRGKPVAPDQAYGFPVLVRVNTDDWHPGCKLVLRIYGRGVPRRPNPSRSGYMAYVKRKGASSSVRLSRRYHVTKVECPAPGWRFRARRTLDRVLAGAGMNAETAGVARGLLLGRSGFLKYELKDTARRLGILHVFAASGLHLGIFFACLAVPLGLLLGRRHWLTFCAPLPLCFAYLWLLDFPVSLTRACLFLALYALQTLLPAYMPPVERLANTALLALLAAPRELASLSGALSFGAVGGILFFFPVLHDAVLRTRRVLLRWLYAQAAISVTASLATTPVLLFAFGAYSYGSPLANLVIVPLVSLLLPLLYLLVVVEVAAGPGATGLGITWVRAAARWGTEGFVELARGLEPLSFYVNYDHRWGPPSWYTVVLLVGLSLAVYWNRRTQRVRRTPAWLKLWIVSAMLLLGPPGYWLEQGGNVSEFMEEAFKFVFMVVKWFPGSR